MKKTLDSKETKNRVGGGMGAGGDLGFCEWILGSAPAQLGELESGVQLERCRDMRKEVF